MYGLKPAPFKERAICDALRSEFVTFLSSVVVRSRKAPKSISQEGLPGFPRLHSGQALRLRAKSPLLCGRAAKRFAQDDDFVWGMRYSWLDSKKYESSKKSQDLRMTISW
jgi:hypothetical protein